MLLVGDVGNSSTVLGLWSGDGRISHRWRIRTEFRRTPDEAGVLLGSLVASVPGAGNALRGACLASVVPSQVAVLGEAADRYLGIPTHEFRFSDALGIRLDVDEPDRVGADRVANTLAAREQYPGATIVVDFGTATNFDVVSPDGAFLGGIIAPGIESGFEAFASRTALLPRVAPAMPTSAIGRTTVANLQIGIYRGAAAMVDGLIGAIRSEWHADARVVATGGLAGSVAPNCRSVDVIDPDLTLKGVGLGHDRLFPRTV